MKLIKITLQFKGFNYKVLDKLIYKVLKKGLLLNFNIKKIIYLPTTNKLFTVLKSPHVNKKARNQFQLLIHKRLLILYFKENELEHVKFFLNFIKSISGGIQIQIKFTNHFSWKTLAIK
jgi:small subunit ribosomal protein S10